MSKSAVSNWMDTADLLIGCVQLNLNFKHYLRL